MNERLITKSDVSVQIPRQGYGQDAVDALVPTGRKDVLDHVIDCCERVMPDLPMLGLAIVLFVLYLAASESGFGVSEDVLPAQPEATDAASAAQGYVPF